MYAKYSINYFPLNILYKDEYTFGLKDGHSTQAGHQVIADSLYNTLKRFISSHLTAAQRDLLQKEPLP